VTAPVLFRESYVKRALLVGIDQYKIFPQLAGAENDVLALRPLLSHDADNRPNFDCEVLTGQVTRDKLLDQLDALLGGGADVSLLYFAGHGDGSGNDVTLVTWDGTALTPGVAFSDVLTKIARSKVPEVIVMLDCCFSGAAGGIPQLGMAGSALRDGVTLLAATRSDQYSEEADARGNFSSQVEDAFAGGAADVLGRVTVAGLYAYLDESFGAWSQRPTFKANVNRLHTLRTCPPTVPLEDLRRLPLNFPKPDTVFGLDPSYDPDLEPHDLEHEAVFVTLRHYRDAGLLEIVDAPHLFGAARDSGGCRLTPLGRRYRAMAPRI
jgi:hypothetical protein